MSFDMARHVLNEYALANGVSFPPNFFTTVTNHSQLMQECIKIRDRKRSDLNLPTIEQNDQTSIEMKTAIKHVIKCYASVA